MASSESHESRTGSETGQRAALEWVERVAQFLAADGVPPIAGRVLGWLMICDPPEQSAGQISDAIGASRASLTTNFRVLMAMGFVTKRTRPGERTAYYRLQDGAWEAVVRRQVASLTAFREVAAEGLTLVGTDSPRADRIREAHAVFDWMARVFDQAPPIDKETS
ncbi:transcriptional regulator [Glycomyces sp. NPDC049804]|uniref:GbsR/MarR family transcriptional regulator n=1 Tax=Glycomyces sp. NPDC049804 TaxID=3154363 RepID=UPI0034379BB7